MAFDLKNEEDVKQYLENLGIEYRFGCFSEKKPEVCHLLGDYMETVKKDFVKAAAIYKSNCDDYGFARSCHKFGGYSFLGKGCKEDQHKSFEYLKKGCTLGEASSCLHAGLMCVSKSPKNKIDIDHPTGFKYLKEACDRGNGLGCFFISGMYISGVPDFLEKNMSEARVYASRACELNEMFSCANLSRMYSLGEGVEKDPVLAEKYKQKAKDLNQQAKAEFQAVQMQQGT